MCLCNVICTDLPTVISTDTVALLDPHQRYTGSNRMGWDGDLAEFLSHSGHASCFDGVFGLTCSTKSFNGTLFRFPLRTTESHSDIVNSSYPVDKVSGFLYESFINEAPIIMLFLKYIEKISLYVNDQLIYKVSVDDSQISVVRKERKALISIATGNISQCSLRVYSMSTVIDDYRQHKHESKQYHWLLMNSIGSSDHNIMQMSKMQQNIPWVGMAASLPESIKLSQLVLSPCNISNVAYCIQHLQRDLLRSRISLPWCDTAQGHLEGKVFCFLPLPNTTYLPVNIHGYFAVSDNRRSIEWPAPDNKSLKARWNEALLKVHIAPLYSLLLSCRTQLVSYTGTPLPLTGSEADVTDPYTAWPLVSNVKYQQIWSELVRPVVNGIENIPVLWTAAQNGKWIKLNEAHYLPATKVPEIAIKILISANVCVVSLPCKIRDTLLECEYQSLIESRRVQPSLVRKVLKSFSHLVNSKADAEKLLEYILSDINPKNSHELLGIKLLPLATAYFQLCPFGNSPHSSDGYLFVGNAQYVKDALEFLPGTEHCFVNTELSLSVLNKLRQLAQWEHFQLRLISPHFIATCLLSKSICSWSRQFRLHQSILWTPGQMGHPPSNWLTNVWAWINQNISIISSLVGLPVVPQQELHTSLSITLLPLPKSSGSYFVERNKDDEALACIIRKMAATIVAYNSFVFQNYNIWNYIQQINVDTVLRYISNNMPLVNRLNNDDKHILRATIAQFYGSTRNIAFREVIRELPIFEVGVGSNPIQLVKLSSSFHILPYHYIMFDDSLNYPRNILSNREPVVVQLIQKLGLPRLTNDQLFVTCILPFALQQCRSSRRWCNGDDLIMWMLAKGSWQLEHALRNESFIRTKSNEAVFKKASELYDINDEQFQKLFTSSIDPVFPSDHYTQKGCLFYNMGLITWNSLRNSSQLVQFMKARADSIQKMPRDAAKQRSIYIMELISANYRYMTPIINELRTIPFVAVQKYPPDCFPAKLQWAGAMKADDFDAPCNMYHNHVEPYLIGSISPIVAKDYVLSNIESYFKSPGLNDVLKQLHILVSTVRFPLADENQVSKVTNMIHCIYKYLDCCYSQIKPNQLPDSWIWWSNEQKQNVFLPLSKFVWKSSLDLSPIIYSLTTDPTIACYKRLFKKAGICESSFPIELVQILRKIATEYPQKVPAHYLKMAVSIVKSLEENKYESSGDIYLPTTENNLCLAKECTFDDREWIRQRVGTGISKHKFVHEDIPSRTARYFGVEPLSKKVAPSEKLRLKYIRAGPKEKVTRRISGIVNDYSGNLDVFKELIQNADDAGASEIKLLIDWREHGTEYLFEQSMKYWQGPAIVAYNNATFSDQDFENICELAAETKMKDPLKTGRFGVGFCSCYSLTDVPSFVSRHFMTIFDPHTKYLGDRVSHNEPGMRIDLVDSRDDLQVYAHQFAPFNGLFDCHIFNLSRDGFNGTIFRFPLRRAGIPNSEISNKDYNKYSVDLLVKELKMEADNLVLFLKNIESLQLYELEESTIAVSEMKLKFEVKKQLETQQSSRIQMIKSPYSFSSPICTSVSVNVVDTNESINTETQYLMCSSLFTSGNISPGLVPLAELAIKLTNNVPDLNVDGRLFCFLPLPLKSNLPFHVNGFFDVGKDRRGLKEAHNSPEYQWNVQLIRNALPSALVSALSCVCKQIKPVLNSDKKDSCLEKYYSLWPGAYGATLQHSTGRCTWISEVFSNAVKNVLCTSNEKILWSDVNGGTWVCFTNAYLFEDCQVVPQEIKTQAIGLLLSKGYAIVEGPHHIRQLLSNAVSNTNQFNYERYFKEIFLPSITHIDCSIRNDQLLFVLSKIQEYSHQSGMYASKRQSFNWVCDTLKNHECIPVDVTGDLAKPTQLIDTRCKPVSSLYDSEEGRFPDKSFKNVMHGLLLIGMVTQEISTDELSERARSVSKIQDNTKCNERLVAIFQYLHYIENRSVQYRYLQNDTAGRNERISALYDIPFIKPCPKPKEISLPWWNSDINKTFLSPSKLYSPHHCSLVFTQEPLFSMPLAEDESIEEDKVVKHLGIDKNEPTVETVLNQLCCLVEYIDGEELDEPTLKYLDDKNVFMSIYRFLDRCRKTDEEMIKTKLQFTRCIWQNKQLLCPQQVIRNWNGRSCLPYLFSLSDNNKKFCELFEAIGVLNKATLKYLIDLLSSIESDHHEVPLSEDLLDFVNVITIKIECLIISREIDCDVLLPDEKGILRPASKLTCDNNLKIEWIEELPVYEKFIGEGGHVTHKTVPRDRAMKLGAYVLIDAVMRDVEDESFLDGTPFGQSEDLVDRLNGILKKYPADSSIFREFIQNADDAQATEIVFVLDHRKNHPEKTLLCDNTHWKQLQKLPALCIFNNKPFSENDVQGICKLGRGGKGDTADTIGRFGIGFNVAYHVTDCPSFISFTDERNPNNFCVFDPLQRYCKKATKSKPGRRWRVTRAHMEQFPDQFQPFLVDKFDEMRVLADCFEDNTKGFVVFRLPFIRYDPLSEYFSSYSYKVHKNKTWLSEGKAHTVFNIQTLLKEFKSSSENMLLFLNHVKSISVFEIQKDSTCLHHFTSTATADRGFTDLPSSNEPTKLICETTITHQVDNGDGNQSKWIISKRNGIKQLNVTGLMSKAEERGLAAFGGVAAQLHTTKPLEGYMFCFLPMNIPNYLPVHLNAHFLVDDSRKHLDSLPGLEKWNSTVAEYLLIPAYIELILEARDKVDGTLETMNWFYNLFPKLSYQRGQASEASQLCMEYLLFEQIFKQDLPILLDAHSITNNNVKWLTPKCGLFCINNILFPNYVLTKSEETQDVLVSLKMPITVAPKHIFNSLNNVSLNKFKEIGLVIPDRVLNWLRDIDLDEDDNKDVIKANCELLLEFCLQNTPNASSTKLDGVPLLLTLANTLSTKGKLFQSRFSELLPHLHNHFIHPSLECSEAVSRLLINGSSIVSLPIEFVSSHIVLENVNDPVKLSDASATFMKLLWEYFKVINAMHQTVIFGSLTAMKISQLFYHKAILPTSDGLLYPPVIGKCVFKESNTQAHVLSTMMKIGYQKLDFSVLGIEITPVFVHSLVSNTGSHSDVLECLNVRPPVISSSLSLTADEVTQFITLLSEAESISTNIASDLKKMPLFQTINDSYICLSKASCFYIKPLSVPCDGILKIQQAINQVVLKVPGHAEEKFYQKVISESNYMTAKGSVVSFYLKFLVPHFSYLDEDELKKHLQFIKSQRSMSFIQSQWDPVIEKLKSTPLIAKDGKRHLVSEFFDPDEKFHATFQKGKLPPKMWCSMDWLPFLKDLGLQSSVTTSLWLTKARKFGEEVSRTSRSIKPSHELVQKSNSLISSFEKLLKAQNLKFETEKLDDSFMQFLRAASKIMFLHCSDPCELIKHVEVITNNSSKEHKYFIQFHESMYFKSADLCCMVRQILPRECHFLSLLKPVFTQTLCIREPLNYKAVVDNLIKLTKVLSTVKVFISSPRSIESIKLIKEIIEKHYVHLEKYLDENEKLIKNLANEECILLTTDKSSFQLVKPNQLVSHIPLGKDFRPFCYKTPQELLKYGKLLKALEIQEDITLLQYINILTNIKLEIDKGGKTLQDDEHFLKVCVSAYEALVSSIRSLSDPPNIPDTLQIYLPSESMHLTKSTNLVYNDVPWIATRLQNSQQKLDYKFLKPPSPDKNGQRTPPSCLRVKLLSMIAVEILHADVTERVNKCVEQELFNNKKCAKNCKVVEVLEETFRTEKYFSKGIGRLYWHKNQIDPKRDRRFCIQLKALTELRSKSIVCVNEIKTIIRFNGKDIAEAEDSSRLCYLVSNNNKLQLYITHRVNNFSEDKLFEELATEISKYLGHCTGDTGHIKAMLQCYPNQISMVLDKREISPYDPQTVKTENLVDKEIGYEISISDVHFNKEDLLIVCNFEEGEKALYHCLCANDTDITFKTVKVLKCQSRNTASLEDKCVKIQTGYRETGDPIIVDTSLLQLYKKLDTSQRKLLECSQPSPYAKPLTLAALPEKKEDVEQWLREIFIYNGRHSCCSVSQLSLRLTTHLHYIFVVMKKAPAMFLPVAKKVIEITQEDGTTPKGQEITNIKSLVKKLKELSIEDEDDEIVGELESPSLSEHIPLKYPYPHNNSPMFTGRRRLFHSNTIPHAAHNVSSVIPSYRITPPTIPQPAVGPGRQHPYLYNRGFRSLISVNENAAKPPKPKTSLREAKIWLQQAKADYLAALELYNNTSTVQEDSDSLDEEQSEEGINEEQNEDMTSTEGEEVINNIEEQNDDEEKDEKEDEVHAKPEPNNKKCKYPALVCFLSHEVVEKCLKGLMYAKCGLPARLVDNTHLLTVFEEMERSVHVTKEVKDVVKECILQVADHSNKSRYPNYHVPPCAPAHIFTTAEACEALRAAKRFMEELKKDDALVDFVRELEEIPEGVFRSALLSVEDGKNIIICIRCLIFLE